MRADSKARRLIQWLKEHLKPHGQWSDRRVILFTEWADTKRYLLGQLLSTVTRHFLLMTATPHNGKEEDFQLFLALLDADRFEPKDRTRL